MLTAVTLKLSDARYCCGILKTERKSFHEVFLFRGTNFLKSLISLLSHTPEGVRAVKLVLRATLIDAIVMLLMHTTPDQCRRCCFGQKLGRGRGIFIRACFF